jgi:hypothetical protein
MITFPLMVSISNYIDALKNKISNKDKEYVSEESKFYSALLIVSIWLIVGMYLF